MSLELKILNRKKIKEILALIKKQWGADFKSELAFLMNTQNKIFLVNREVFNLNLKKLRINSIGLYFGELKNNELRLSIEGSQLIGPLAKKNSLELNEKEARAYLKGADLDKKTKERGFLIIKYKGDFLGTGKASREKIYNYMPKERRIRVSD